MNQDEIKKHQLNAEEDYMTTPISVLSYITKLESQAENLTQQLKNIRLDLLGASKTIIEQQSQIDEYTHTLEGSQEHVKQLQDKLEIEISNIINYIEKDAEIAMPIDELINLNGSHITKKQYGLVLLKYLVIELRNKFLNNM